MKIKIKSGNVEAKAELSDSYTAKRIFEKLPFSSLVQTWGDEIYFSIPIKLGEDDAKIEVEVGELGYWPPGNAFCIFFGRTPASKSNKPRAASNVNVFGKITGDPLVFKSVKDGSKIIVEKL
ncbi:hypothetical protein HYT56_05015 [Candidatus Woesearchaeota archaeon]|nr:hypothetical protein [Candidatus Woesearchaeota archaeon]